MSIYLFLPTKKKADAPASGMQQVNYSLIKYKSDFFSKQDDTVQTKLKDLESKIDQASDSLSKIKAYSDLIDYYNRIESPENSAKVVLIKPD